MLPVILRMEGKNCLVFGGGKVAERRIEKLLKARARVKAVSRSFTPSIKAFSNVELVEGELSPEEVKSYIGRSDFVFALTSSEEFNSLIEEEARAQAKLVNRADRASDIVIPASIEVGELIVSVSTMGKAPLAARLIKEKLKKSLTQEDILLINFNKFLREELKRSTASARERQVLMRDIIESKSVSECIARGELQEAKTRAMEFLEESKCTR